MEIKERILEKSLELFLNKGCKSVTMDDVAGENGISKRTLYEHFNDKSTLLIEAIHLYGKKMRDSYNSVSNGSDNILDQFFKLNNLETELSINLKINFFSDIKKFYPEIFESVVNQMICNHDEVIKDGITRGQQQGLFRSNINIEIVSKVISQLGGMVDNTRVSNERQFSRKEIFKEAIINYIRGISTLKGIEIIDNYLNK